MTLRVAFIGLGAIGAPMARRLTAVAETVLWNRTAARAEALAVATGAQAAPTAAAAAAGVDVFMICLPTSAEVEDVLFGSGAAADALAAGSVVVDCTSGDPGASRVIAARLAERGIGFLDAPVSGGVSGAEAGKLTVMVGGDAALVDRVRPVLHAFAATIVHCGPVGSGDAVKAVNNALLAVHIWSTAEGLATLASMGVDAAVALGVINASSGRSNTSEVLFPQRVLTRAFPRTFRLALLDKDARIAAEMAARAGVPAELLALTSRLFAEARRELGEEADHVEAVRVVEERGHVQIGTATGA